MQLLAKTPDRFGSVAARLTQNTCPTGSGQERPTGCDFRTSAFIETEYVVRLGLEPSNTCCHGHWVIEESEAVPMGRQGDPMYTVDPNVTGPLTFAELRVNFTALERPQFRANASLREKSDRASSPRTGGPGRVSTRKL